MPSRDVRLIPVRITPCGPFVIVDVLPDSSQGATVAIDLRQFQREPHGPEVEPWMDEDEEDDTLC